MAAMTRTDGSDRIEARRGAGVPLPPPAARDAGGVRVSFVVRDVHLALHANRITDLAHRIAGAGLDGAVVGDHVSFRDGSGIDGLVAAGSLLAAHPSLPVATGIYLLPLRHPVLVARQLATIAMIAPGRFTFGVGVGGEDPHEFHVCGVDPHTRGARTDEALDVVRRLLRGETVTHHGTSVSIEGALIAPAPDPEVPVVVGGRSDAALTRAALRGDGWIGLWVSPRRFAGAIAGIDHQAAAAGRRDVSWRHAYQAWCFFAPMREQARARAQGVLASSYGIGFERFERYTPIGSPADVAEALHPYVGAGCRSFNLVADAVRVEDAIESAAETKRILAGVSALALGTGSE